MSLKFIGYCSLVFYHFFLLVLIYIDNFTGLYRRRSYILIFDKLLKICLYWSFTLIDKRPSLLPRKYS